MYSFFGIQKKESNIFLNVFKFVYSDLFYLFYILKNMRPKICLLNYLNVTEFPL
jgi:hypothetical protein